MPFSRPPKEQMNLNLDRFSDVSQRRAEKFLVATAADVRKTAQRSLKSGGKNRYSKTYKSSKPGEPPLTHGSRLKRSIRYEINGAGAVTVGAPSFAGSKTAGVLEKGGSGSITETRARDDYFERRKKNARLAKKNRSAANVPPLKSKRAYTLVSESGSTRRVSVYERFKSEQAAKRAAAAPKFQAWRGKVQETKTTETNVQARPFVKPAVEKETDIEKEQARWARIVRTGVLKNR